MDKQDKQLIKKAKSLAKEKHLAGGVARECVSILITEKGNMFIGVNIDLRCGIGFCSEHSAIANMLTQGNETVIKTIVTCNPKSVLAPCGRCRELLRLIDEKNFETDVIISEDKKVKLKELLPFAYQIEK